MESARFRLGSTSYVYPGDLVHNASHLAGQASDIELVLFDTQVARNIPTPEEIERLAQIAARSQLTFTVHLPFDLPVSPDRIPDALQAIGDLVRLTHPLSPYAYVFHIESAGAGSSEWTRGALEIVSGLCELVAMPSCLALENLESYSPEFLEPIFASLPISRTLDIGHLWKAGIDPLPVITRWLSTTRVVHLHGMTDRDHVSLAEMPIEKVASVIKRLRHWEGVLTLEVFEEDFFSSRDVVYASLGEGNS